MIRVFVVDDSTFVRKAIVKVLHRDPELRVVGEAASGAEALRTIAGANPDVVTLDLAMPGLDGLQALRGLLAWRSDLPVLMLSAHTHEGAAATIEALAIGAVDFVDKSAFSVLDLDSLGRQLVERIKLWGPSRPRRARPGRRWWRTPDAPEAPASLSQCDLCVIGTSTGGPPALQYIFERLPAAFPMPDRHRAAHAARLHQAVRRPAEHDVPAGGARGPEWRLPDPRAGAGGARRAASGGRRGPHRLASG